MLNGKSTPLSAPYPIKYIFLPLTIILLFVCGFLHISEIVVSRLILFISLQTLLLLMVDFFMWTQEEAI